MDTYHQIYFCLGFLFCGVVRYIIIPVAADFYSKIESWLSHRIGGKKQLIALMEEYSAVQDARWRQMFAEIEELKSVKPTTKTQRQTKKATHQQKHVNGKDETTEESVQ